MTDQEVLDLIRKALNDVMPDRSADWNNIALANTIEELSLDSIATMEMVSSLEELTDTTFPDEALPKVNTLNDLANLARKGSL